MFAAALAIAGSGLSAAWRFIRPIAPWILVAVVGAVVWHWTPIVGPRAQLAALEERRATLETERDDWRRAAQGWEASYRSSEALRGRERTTAQAAAASLIEQCSARVAEARASARVVERIVTREPTYDESRCPVRERVDPGLLRDALRPSAGTD